MAVCDVGDTYPPRFGYDTQGRKTLGQTTRDDGATWNETRWEFDAASGLNTAKVYADGSRITYAYAADGKKTRTTWARGAWKENAYSVRRLVGGTTYSDETPSVAYEYDAARKRFAESLTRSKARRELVTHRAYSFDGRSIYQYSTNYDILGRPTNAVDSISLARAWVYNRRAELVAATFGTNDFNYAYDTIGNRLTSSANSATNTYSANSLNQYTSILCGSAALRETKTLTYDADGNLISDGSFSYAYDAENRLVSILPLSPMNGSFAVENRYDHRHRRTQKVGSRFANGEWAWAGTHIYVWDGDNIVLERIAFADGAERVCEYFWGLDKSGTEQGAGGVGGLLAVSIDGVFYLPCYDHNGNIVVYVSESGDIAAQLVYDPYGNVIEQYGEQATQFSFGFSTKIHDREISLVAYQRRFYSPDLGRWLNRDPIEEQGGMNLYQFVLNSPAEFYDADGRFAIPVTTFPFPESNEDSQESQSPSVFDQFGNGKDPFHEEAWFNNNYSGWISEARRKFISEINASIDCKTTQISKKSSRQSVSPGLAGNMPWGMPTGGNDRLYGDKGQNNWQAAAVLGDFAIDYVTPVQVSYGACRDGSRSYRWSTTMYVEDVLGLQGDEGWIGKYFGWAAKSRRVKRAQWSISNSGTCKCCN